MSGMATRPEFLMVIENSGDLLENITIYKIRMVRQEVTSYREFKEYMLSHGVSIVFYGGYLWSIPLAGQELEEINRILSSFLNKDRRIIRTRVSTIFETFNHQHAMALIKNAIKYAIWLNLDEKLLRVEQQQNIHRLLKTLEQPTIDKRAILNALFEKARVIISTHDFTRLLVLSTAEGIGIYKPAITGRHLLRCRGIILRPIRIDRADVGLSLLPRATIRYLKEGLRKASKTLILKFRNYEDAYDFVRRFAQEIFPLRVPFSDKMLKFNLPFLGVEERRRVEQPKRPGRAPTQRRLTEWLK